MRKKEEEKNFKKGEQGEKGQCDAMHLAKPKIFTICSFMEKVC